MRRQHTACIRRNTLRYCALRAAPSRDYLTFISRADHYIHIDIIRNLTHGARQEGVKVTGKKNDLGEVVIYRTKDSKTALDVRLVDETVWLTQAQMAKLFERDQSVISRHINSVFKEKELDQKSNMQKMHIAKSDKPVVFYGLDMIISVGYRVNSKRGTQFRIWATQTLKDHLVEVNPKVMLGKPMIRGTRIPVELILRKLGEGATEADILDAYPGLTHDTMAGSDGLF